VAEAIALVLEKPELSSGKAYNTSGERLSMADFMRAWKAAGGKASWAFIPIPVPIDRYFEIDRAKNELGWKNRPFLDGLKETFEREKRG